MPDPRLLTGGRHCVTVGVHPTALNTLHFVESRLGVLDFLFRESKVLSFKSPPFLAGGLSMMAKVLPNVWDGAVKALRPGGGAPIL